jgi:protocatechuate 3,4-dioxygenase beta subunit
MHGQPQPAYQGRLLPRPDEELTDQGLAFDLGTLLRRRQLLRVFGAGAATLGIAACGDPAEPAPPPRTPGTSAPPALARIPEETRGPFPGDGSNGPDILERSGVVRKDVRSSLGASSPVPGVTLDLELTLPDLSGAAVYIWQCDATGRYSMYGDGVSGETFLRGVQITDRAGKVRFTSVFPGCYPGRWPHVHFEVYPDRDSIADHGTVLATSQLAFPQDVCETVYERSEYGRSAAHLADVSLDTDMVFRDDRAVLQTATVTGDPAGGYRAALTVGVTT